MDILFKREPANVEILAAKGNIPLWKLAEKAGVHESTIIRWFRKEMTDEQKAKVKQAINDVKREQVVRWGS